MTNLGICILGRLPNGRLEGVHMDTPEGAKARITAARNKGRYSEIILAEVTQRQPVEADE